LAIYNASVSKEKNEIGSLIRAERKKQGLTQGELADVLLSFGVSVKAAAVAKWENGDNVPSGYQLLAICHALHLREGILAFAGSAAPEDMNAEGYRFLNEFHHFLVASGRYDIAGRGDGSTVEMRVYDLPVSAGTGNLLDSDCYEIQSFPARSVPHGADFGVHVAGDSMEPDYHNGQIVWVHACEQLHDGDIGVFFYDGCSYIKEYHEKKRPSPAESFADSDGILRPRIVYHSLNPDYPDIPIEDGVYQLFGKVLNEETHHV